MEQLRGLIEWCAGGADVVRPRVVSALVYGYEDTRVVGAWSGFLAYAAEDVVRFDGRLPAISRRAGDRDALDVSIRVRVGGTAAFVAASGWSVEAPLLDPVLRNGIVEARCETRMPERRFSCFLQAANLPVGVTSQLGLHTEHPDAPCVVDAGGPREGTIAGSPTSRSPA